MAPRSLPRAGSASLDVSTLPSGIIHGDFTPWNLLFTEGSLTGIIDFDLAMMTFGSPTSRCRGAANTTTSCSALTRFHP